MTKVISLLVDMLGVSIPYIYPNFSVVIFSWSYWIIDLVAYYSNIILYDFTYHAHVFYSESNRIERPVIWGDKGLTIFLCVLHTKVRKLQALSVTFQEQVGEWYFQLTFARTATLFT
jgi:hypothetical protein